jgi:hypothetical protein
VEPVTADAEFENRSARGPRRTGVLTRSPQRTEKQRIPRPYRERQTVRHGPDPNPCGTENPLPPSPSQTSATTRTKRPRQHPPPGSPSTTLATRFRSRAERLPGTDGLRTTLCFRGECSQPVNPLYNIAIAGRPPTDRENGSPVRPPPSGRSLRDSGFGRTRQRVCRSSLRPSWVLPPNSSPDRSRESRVYSPVLAQRKPIL